MNDLMTGRIHLNTQPINGYQWELFHQSPAGSATLATYRDPYTTIIHHGGNKQIMRQSHSTCQRIIIEAWVTEQTKILMLQELLMPKMTTKVKFEYGLSFIKPEHFIDTEV